MMKIRFALLALAAMLMFAAAAQALSFVQIAQLNGSEANDALNGFQKPTGLFIDGAGRIYVADTDANRVLVYMSNLSYLTTKGGVLGGGPTELDGPEGVCIGGNGRFYIADTFNHRIQIYTDYSGTFFKTLPELGGESYTLHRPRGVAVDIDGNIHVADTFNNRIQVFAPSGMFIQSIFSAEHYGDYVLKEPSSIYIDTPRNRILVADTGNQRVQAYTMNYTYLARIGWGAGEEALSDPMGVWVDSTGRIYVADTGNNRIAIFSSNYTYITELKGSDQGFSEPHAVALDSLGRVFVSDAVGKKVLVFQTVDVELEAAYARNKVQEAHTAYDAALALQAGARELIGGIMASGCTDAPEAASFLDGSRASLATANLSLSRADTYLGDGRYTDAVSEADTAASFAAQAAYAANQSMESAHALGQAAEGAIREMIAAEALVSRADSLNATAQRLNIRLSEPETLANARSLIADGSTFCSQGRYPDAEQSALKAQGNATSALSALEQQLNLVVIPRYAELRSRYDLDQANVSIYGLPVDMTPVAIELSLANTLILDSKYAEALDKMASVSESLSAIEANIQAYTHQTGAFRAQVSASLNSSRERLALLRAIAANYSQQLDDRYVVILLSQAEANLSLDDLAKANVSLSSAAEWLDAANATLLSQASEIESAKAAIATARADIEAAKAASVPLLNADVGGAVADVSSAEALVYSEPARARALAEQASQEARGEQQRIGSQKPAYYLGIAVVILMAVIVLILFTGAAAGIYAVAHYLKKSAEKIEKMGEKAIGIEERERPGTGGAGRKPGHPRARRS